MSYKDDREFSENVQELVVKPKFLNNVWPNAKIISSDLQNDDLARVFDYFGATDKIVVTENGSLIQMGLRIQRMRYAKYESLTIRDKRVYKDGFERASEYQKLITAIANDTSHANCMCHCYTNGNGKEDSNDLKIGMIVKTKDLLSSILDGRIELRDNETSAANGQKQKFKYVYFKDIKKVRPDIIIAEYRDGRVYKNIAMRQQKLPLEFCT